MMYYVEWGRKQVKDIEHARKNAQPVPFKGCEGIILYDYVMFDEGPPPMEGRRAKQFALVTFKDDGTFAEHTHVRLAYAVDANVLQQSSDPYEDT